MLNITYQDRKTNIWVREKTKVTDVIEQVRRRKWTWAEHVSMIRDNRWTVHITTWKPYERKRPTRGRPVRRWRDELDDYWKVPSGRGQCWIGRWGSSILRPSHNHRTLFVCLQFACRLRARICFLVQFELTFELIKPLELY